MNLDCKQLEIQPSCVRNPKIAAVFYSQFSKLEAAYSEELAVGRKMSKNYVFSDFQHKYVKVHIVVSLYLNNHCFIDISIAPPHTM